MGARTNFHIREDIIQSILDSANIRQVVEEFVPLRKRGRNWVGLCPFHSDKDPSFSVNEEKQIFYCFGCGQGGDAIGFLMRMQGLSFIEALKKLAGLYGIDIPEAPLSYSETKRRKESEGLVGANEEASRFYQNNLLGSKRALNALKYLEKRGIGNDIITRFGLGYAEAGWDSLLNHLKSRQVMPELAEKAGLVVQRDGGGYYDRFRDRIIFPIHNKAGDIVALGGRILGDGSPKYLNSPETNIYKKGHVLYGLHKNKDAIRQAGRGYVVEGYMDLLALVQAGVNNVVATLGTALTQNHIKLLKGLTKDWVLVFDGDEAGLKASLRALPLFYQADMRVKIISLPGGDDPDTFVRREGRDVWGRMAEEAPTGIDFVMTYGISTHGKGPDGKARLIEEIISILKPIADPVKKSLLTGYVAQKLAIREEALWERLRPEGSNRPDSDTVSGAGANAGAGKSNGVDRGGLSKAEAKLIGFFMEHHQYVGQFMDAGLELWIKEPILKDLWIAIQHQYSIKGVFNFQEFIEMLGAASELKAAAIRLSECSPPCEDPDEMARGLRRYCGDRKIKALRRLMIDEIEATNKEEEKESLLKKMQRLG